MNQTQQDMNEAVADWLESYKGNERYLAATENLFEVFARSWQGSRRYLAEAFSDFREALLKEHGFKHLEVVTVFPKQRPESER
jgi:cupin superfamily acireductone dioxygenase involved in methionine salvage